MSKGSSCTRGIRKRTCGSLWRKLCWSLLSLLWAVERLSEVAVIRRKHLLALRSLSPLLLRPSSTLGSLIVCGLMLRRSIAIDCVAAWRRKRPWCRHSRHHGTHWRSNSDRIRVAVRTTFNLISWWQEGVEALNQVRVTRKERGYTLDDPWSIYRATLEVLHDIQESIIDVRVVSKLNLDLIEVAQGIL